MEWFNVEIAQINKETTDATSVVFDLPDTLKQTFQWQAGQYIRLKLTIDGQPLSRNYSISCSGQDRLRITVKKVQKGQVSTFINDKLAIGDSVQITAPIGSFQLIPKKTKRRSFYFFAAGSGITPIYSMLTTMLDAEPHSYGYLLYGNKSAKTTIFLKQLEQLKLQYADRLVIQHCHSSPSWFSEAPWRTGRVDSDAVSTFIKENAPYAQDCYYYICGPGSFIPNIEQALTEIDVPITRIHTESFGGLGKKMVEAGLAADLLVNLKNNQYQITVKAGQSLLQAMLEAGIDVPYSCEGGVCGTCQCKLSGGEVKMLNNMALDDNEVSLGKILACQSIAITKKLEVDY